ncbi:MAG: hypothetical protein HN542_07155 [Flavobacteriales bacterium]|nr:hypothetical protein [Flavobacteriales bacterium]NCG30453.1 hypothetical protein [Bacteroidota bacterium]MBT3964271.1 hypothetical protein [Flavobacteriales bacterium]MBT4705918.1 hypothetical protein [Flavobacteriales bacterium]MBT5131704.1 hypothetical protein [Flavobacteriales bacterium]
MRIILVSIFLLVQIMVGAQMGLVPIEHFSNFKLEQGVKDSLSARHFSLKPISYWTVQSTFSDTADKWNCKPLGMTDRKVKFAIEPILSVFGYSQQNTSTLNGFSNQAGISTGIVYKNKVYLNYNGILGWSQPPDYQRQVADSLGVFPGFGRKIDRGPNYSYNQSTFCLAYKPSEHFELFAGRGRHFIGEGFRSVFLSDFASNYNYFKADVEVWKVKYSVLYTGLKQTYDYPTRFYPLKNKFSTMHYLSVNLTKWWNIGLFEAVVWEQEDSVVNRGYDIQYLNPIIFFRPVEYGLGSSDNSLLGLSTTIRPNSSLTLYGQLLLDEFLFSEVNAPWRVKLTGDSTIKTGWWANKQSLQVGFKLIEPFGWKNATALAEFNMVRPFTYGHSNRIQSFTHMNQSLAHPLGSNFIEWVQVTTWQPDKWRFGLFTTYARKGFSNNLGFLGDDPLVSNTERDLNSREHGNFLLQGKRVDITNVRAVAGYVFIESLNARAEISINYHGERTKNLSANTVIFGIGLKTALWNDELFY